jgi:hypothetical protein
VFEERVEVDEEFTHGGGKGEFGRFAVRAKAEIEGGDDRVVSGSDESRHVESGANVDPAAVDVALTTEEAAIAIEGSQASQRGGLIFGEGAEFWKAGDEGDGGSRPHAFDLGESRDFGVESRAGSDDPSQSGIDEFELLVEGAKQRAMEGQKQRICAAQPITFGGAHGNELLAAGGKGSQLEKARWQRPGR